jgi:hypothetical protein
VDRARYLLILSALGPIVALVLLSTSLTAVAAKNDCTFLDRTGGTCATRARVTSGAVEIDTTRIGPGTPDARDTTAHNGTAHAGAVPTPEPTFYSAGKGGGQVSTPATPAKPRSGASPVGLADIASFRPVPGVAHMQPNGWAVMGLNTNFYAATGQHVVDGTLLGRPASVRFTPIGFQWNYGDGASTVTNAAGNTWDALRLAEFDPTPSSHRYTTRGTYPITLSIDFAPEYRYDDGGWIVIDGVVSTPANPLTVTTGKIKTVLVAHDCLADPDGPGC